MNALVIKVFCVVKESGSSYTACSSNSGPDSKRVMTENHKNELLFSAVNKTTEVLLPDW
jgi:hypothetical protein